MHFYCIINIAISQSFKDFSTIFLLKGERYDKRKKENLRNVKFKEVSLEKTVEIICDNDIIEIEVYFDNHIIEIGASSECKYTSVKFENKKYYIMEFEYDTKELFVEKLNSMFPNGNIPIVRMDGLELKYWNKDLFN